MKDLTYCRAPSYVMNRQDEEEKEEIWLGPKKNAPTLTEK